MSPLRARSALPFLLVLSLVMAASARAADLSVVVTDPWARATAPGQKVAAAYMTLRADAPLRLEGVSSPVARSAELHEMRQDGDVMRMRAQPHLDLPAGQAVDLRPGGLHVMLFGLNKRLEPGQRLALTLRLRKADGKVIRQTVDVPVRAVDDPPPRNHPR